MARKQQEFFRAVKPRAASGAERQRLVAIALLTYAMDDEAVEVVQRVRDDAKLSAELRRDALQVLLAMKGKKDAVRLAVSVMEDKDSASRKLGLRYLVEGREGLDSLRETISLKTGSRTYYYFDSSEPNLLPQPPKGLKASQLRPFLGQPDQRAAAEAGYLLALLGEPEGLPALMRFVRTEKEKNWTRAGSPGHRRPGRRCPDAAASGNLQGIGAHIAAPPMR